MRFLFEAFELLMVILAVLCLLHARSRGRLTEFFTLIVYGLLLEELTILFFGEYEYGDGFLMMIRDVPLGVGLGWAAIIYSAMETSDLLGVPRPMKPLYDTLLALNIDLSMDTIAFRVGFWKWLNGGEWFGVPYGNFLGWICVVFFFSFTTRWLREHPPGHEVVRPAAILAGSIIPLILLLKVWVMWVPDMLKGWIIAAILLGFLAAVLLKTKGIFNTAFPDLSMLAVPFVFHLFFLFLLVNGGFYVQVPLLLPLSLGMLLLGVAGHFPGHIRRLIS